MAIAKKLPYCCNVRLGFFFQMEQLHCLKLDKNMFLFLIPKEI